MPNEPECANFASVLRHLLLHAISTQPCYVSTLCVEFAPLIRNCKFAQIWRMRRRMRWMCAKKNCKKNNCRMRKKTEKVAGYEPTNFGSRSHYSINWAIQPLLQIVGKLTHYIEKDAVVAQFWRNFLAHTSTHAQILAQLRQLRQKSRRPVFLRLKKSLYFASYKGFPAAGWRIAVKKHPRSLCCFCQWNSSISKFLWFVVLCDLMCRKDCG